MPRAPDATVAGIEDAMLSTWPARATSFDGAWIIRLSDGFTDRANAFTVSDPADDDALGARLDAVEALYASRGLLPRLRETPLAPPRLLAALATRGYAASGDTIVLAGNLPRAGGAPCGVHRWSRIDDATATPRLVGRVKTTWLDAACACSPRLAANRAALVALFAAHVAPTAFLARIEDAEPVAVAQACRHRDWLTLHNVATHAEHRRQGQARALMDAAFAWGQTQGATRAWVAVEADNAAARDLYGAYGLAEAYRYRYWSPT